MTRPIHEHCHQQQLQIIGTELAAARETLIPAAKTAAKTAALPSECAAAAGSVPHLGEPKRASIVTMMG
jgi:hypothetical protein